MNIAEKQWETMNKTLKWKGSEDALLLGLRALATPTYYPMLCAWCQAEGVRTLVRWSTIEHSSGICQRHVAEMNAESSKLKAESNTPSAFRVPSSEFGNDPVNPVDPVGVPNEEKQPQASAL